MIDNHSDCEASAFGHWIELTCKDLTVLTAHIERELFETERFRMYTAEQRTEWIQAFRYFRDRLKQEY